MNIITLFLHYFDLLTDMYAVYVFNSKGHAVAAEYICALVFLIIPYFLAAIFSLIDSGNDVFSRRMRFMLVLTGLLYPLCDIKILNFRTLRFNIFENNYMPLMASYCNKIKTIFHLLGINNLFILFIYICL